MKWKVKFDMIRVATVKRWLSSRVRWKFCFKKLVKCLKYSKGYRKSKVVLVAGKRKIKR